MPSKILIDTHCFLWWLAEPSLLSAESTGLIADRSNSIFVSAATSWEIAIKYRLGKLDLSEAPETIIPKAISAIGAQPLSIHHAHALRAGSLPLLHRDPFDRLLVAQAQLEQLILLTSDPRIAQYDVETVWAGTK